MYGAEDVIPNFPGDAFAGTADYYLQYRPPYPAALLNDLVARARLSGSGLLVDLACGPGRVAFGLNAHFAETWAVDLESGMIDAGRSQAVRMGASKITWIVGRAEEFACPPGAAELVTVGEAFHRLEQRRVAANALQWLKPGGCMATLGTFSVLSGREPWQRAILDVVHRWTAGRQRTSDGLPLRKPGGSPEHNEAVLRAAGFAEVATRSFPMTHAWTLEAIVGYLYSTSVASKAVLGREAEAFEADLKRALLAHEPGGVYREDPQWGYTLGRKPL